MTNPNEQSKSSEWHEQWSIFKDDERFLFEEWIAPATIEDFREKSVLECGCGGGQHTSYIAPVAIHITAVDLNTVEIARERNSGNKNVKFLEADIATMDLGEQFDVVICIGVIHHTNDPDATFKNIYRHCKPGGKIIIWTYSAEGNELVRHIVEPFRKYFLKKLSRKTLVTISEIITTLMYPLVHTVYRLSLFRFLPFFYYFKNFRKLSFKRNMLNVFDKLNAPQTHFISYDRCKKWFPEDLFIPESISIRKYAGVSYSLVGIKRDG